MLYQFSFSNFKSFKEEALLDLYAEPISEMEETLIIDNEKQKLLPVISMYGPNGGGKSTVIYALKYLILFITRQIIFFKDEEENKDVSFFPAIENDIYFKFDDTHKNMPTNFEILFSTLKSVYKYELSLQDGVIKEENLYYRIFGEKQVNLLFERTSTDISLGKELENLPLDKIRNTVPFFSYIAVNYNIPVVDAAVKWIMHMEFLDYNDSRFDKRIRLPRDPAKMELLIRLLNRMDINITSIRVEENEKGGIKEIYTTHAIGGNDYVLTLKEESSGTRKLFSCLARIVTCLEEGRLMLADELDAKLHPKILRFLIELFKDKTINKKGAQLIMTSHDMVNMSHDVFRRDEIWFCSQGRDRSSTLYSLVSFVEKNGKKVRMDAKFSKRYLEGYYGADPYIEKGLCWGE